MSKKDKTETLPATRQDTPAVNEGLEAMDQGDFMLPRYRIVQPTSQEGNPGTLLCGLSGEEYTAIRIVPLAVTKSRVLLPPIGEEGVLCRSGDAITPNSHEPASAACAEKTPRGLKTLCPEAQWIDRKPPACALVYNLLALNLDAAESPFLIGLKRSNVKPIKRLTTWIGMRGIPAYAMSCTMSLNQIQGAQGRYYVVDFGDHELVEPADKYRQRYLDLQSAAGDPEDNGGGKGAADQDIPF